MNFAAFQWRAGKGYLPQPGSMPQPLYCGPAYWAYPPLQNAHPGPLLINGVIQQPYHPGPVIPIPPRPAAASIASTPAPHAPAPSAKKCAQAKSAPKMDNSITKLASVAAGESSSGKEDKSAKQCKPPPGTDSTDGAKTVLTNAHAPPPLRPGDQYLFPRQHTMLHIFNKASQIWEDKYRGQGLRFKIFKVGTAFAVDAVIERIVKGGQGKGWAATEVFEVGDGGWRKGSTVEWGGEKGKATLEEMGWGARRGDARGLGPVWLVIHKV